MKLPSLLIACTFAGLADAQALSPICSEVQLDGSPADAGDNQGAEVAVAGGVAVVSAPSDASLGPYAGAVYVYEQVQGAWVQTAKLLASDGVAYDSFGRSIATDGELIVVGALDHAHAGEDETGAVYVFEKVGGVWTEIDEIYGGGRVINNTQGYGDSFGSQVAVDDDRIAVSAPGIGSQILPDGSLNLGRVYVYPRGAGGWDPLQRKTLADPCCGEFFGNRLHMDGNRLVILDPGKIGAPTLVTSYVATGGNQWVFEDQLSINIGDDIDLDGTNLLVSKPTAKVGGQILAGKVHLYGLSQGAWQLDHVFQAPTPTPLERYGDGIAIDGNQIVIGASSDELSQVPNAGVAHTYYRDGSGNWVYGTMFSPAQSQESDSFGSDVSIHGQQVLVGARNYDRPPSGEIPQLSGIGTAYLLELTPAVPSSELLRTGTPANPLALQPGLATGPAIGAVWDPSIDHSSFYPSATMDLLALSTKPPINLPIAAGTLLCSLPPANQIRTVAAGQPFNIAVPLDCSLLGATGCVQGASTGPNGLRLTNGIDITVGSY